MSDASGSGASSAKASAGGGASSGTQGSPLKRVVSGLLVFYAVAFALNAVALHRNSESLRYGFVRTFWTTLSAPAAKACERLGLDRPRAWLEHYFGAPLNAP